MIGAPRGVRLAAVSTAVLLATACGFATKKQNTDLIRSAPRKLKAAGAAKASFGLGATIVRSRLGVTGPTIAAAATSRAGGDIAGLPRRTQFSFSLDFVKRRGIASLASSAPDQPPVAVQMVSEDALYQRRIGQQSQDTTGGRPWVKLEFQPLYDDREDLTASGFGNNTLNPIWLVDLLGGALTGSVQKRGVEQVRGVRTTHFRVNFAFDKFFDQEPEETREGVQAALAIMGADYEGVHKGDVWLDAKGLPRRLEVTVRQSRDRRDVIDVRYALELFDIGTPLELHLPKKKEISRVDTFGDVLQATGTAGA